MLSPLDDYPVHQIAEPIRHVGTSDRNFYDRYYFNIHGCSDELFCVIGLGQYPNLGVADAFVAVRRGNTHRVVRSSRALGADRMDTSVGPIRVEVLEGLRRLRVVLEPNDWGIELDAVFEGMVEAHMEPRHFHRQFERVIFDSVRLAQTGGWTGTLKVAGETIALTPDRWWGSRDRSWGVRPVGEAEPPGIRVTDTQGGFFWIYAPVQFDDHALITIIQEEPDGRRILEAATRMFPEGSGREVEWLGRPEHELRFAPGTRDVTGATLRYHAPGGRVTEVDAEVLLPFPLMRGTGYGLEPNWRHGMWQGQLSVEGEIVDLTDPAEHPWGLVENAARFTYDGQVGYGMLEVAVIGRHEQYGLDASSGWEPPKKD